MNLIRETFFNSLGDISKLLLTTPKIFTIWLLIEKDCRLLLYRHFKIKRYTTCWLQKKIIEIDKENILNKILLIFCETYVAYYSASLNNTNLKRWRKLNIFKRFKGVQIHKIWWLDIGDEKEELRIIPYFSATVNQYHWLG